MTVNKTFDLDQGLLPLALSVFRANLLPWSLAVILLLGSYVGAGFLIAPLAYAALRSLIIMIVGYSAYRTLTSGGKVTGFRAVGTGSGRVPWRYAGIMLLILSPILLLGIIWTAPGSGAGPDSFAQMAFGVIMVTSYAVLYVLFGTALPEVAERGEVSLAEAFERGRSNYRVIAKAMVLGPWLFRAGSMLALILLSLAGVTVDLFHHQTGAFQMAALAPMLFFSACYIFGEVLTAIVLVRAYRRFQVAVPGAATA
jgi:hypothetical protein